MSIKPKVFNDRFAFCSGFENSYPVITDHRGKDLRRDGFDLSGHYHHWRHDLKLVSEMGLDYLRYGPPYYRMHVGPGRYDWSFTDETFQALRAHGRSARDDLARGVADAYHWHNLPKEVDGDDSARSAIRAVILAINRSQ